jgi:hypothetical protein
MTSLSRSVFLFSALALAACAQQNVTPAPSIPRTPPDGPPPARTADDHAPSTEQERRLVVQWTQSLEDDPLQPAAQDTRARLLLWALNVPDIQVTLCGSLLGPVLGQQGPLRAILVGQMTFGGAVFSIEHPDRAGDLPGQRLAGLESALRAYEHLLAARPEVRSPYLDDLLARRSRNQLAGVAEKCPDK